MVKTAAILMLAFDALALAVMGFDLRAFGQLVRPERSIRKDVLHPSAVGQEVVADEPPRGRYGPGGPEDHGRGRSARGRQFERCPRPHRLSSASTAALKRRPRSS